MIIDFNGNGGGSTGGTVDTTARNMASAAQTKANQAYSAATSAQTVAENAYSAATSAQTTAEQAYSAATEASTAVAGKLHMISLTQAEYDALTEYDQTALYNITDAE